MKTTEKDQNIYQAFRLQAFRLGWLKGVCGIDMFNPKALGSALWAYNKGLEIGQGARLQMLMAEQKLNKGAKSIL